MKKRLRLVVLLVLALLVAGGVDASPMAADQLLKIVKFNAEPLALGSGETFSSIEVRVRNVGSAQMTPVVSLAVLDALTGQPLNPEIASRTINCPTGAVAPGNECDWENLSAEINVSSLAPGTYKLVAEAYALSTGELHGTKALFFSIGKGSPIPEFSVLLLPLLLACVLLVLWKR